MYDKSLQGSYIRSHLNFFKEGKKYILQNLPKNKTYHVINVKNQLFEEKDTLSLYSPNQEQCLVNTRDFSELFQVLRLIV